jgi:hypothetical protein
MRRSGVTVADGTTDAQGFFIETSAVDWFPCWSACMRYNIQIQKAGARVVSLNSSFLPASDLELYMVLCTLPLTA